MATAQLLVAPARADPSRSQDDWLGNLAGIVMAARGQGDADVRHYEIWTGADVGHNVWLAYTGTTIAPFGDIHEQGWRLRFTGGYGGYRYESFDLTAETSSRHRAEVTFADALVGYLWRFDPLILKAFVGVGMIDHRIEPFDAQNLASGPDLGIKGALELWLNIGNDAYASVDLTMSEAHLTRSARARLGYRYSAAISTGLEAGINADRQSDFKVSDLEQASHRTEAWDYARTGAFARYEWYGGEVSASAGLSGDVREARDKATPYATVNWIKQF
ncbi:MAG: cellulose biosynthesis protein BcsS [Hyphomicrobiaceae bacterium]|nr:cellulose biosynthesis protein BcsS [Hyphomicrobiaceae bacterium]